jgi:hypothetical protein
MSAGAAAGVYTGAKNGRIGGAALAGTIAFLIGGPSLAAGAAVWGYNFGGPTGALVGGAFSAYATDGIQRSRATKICTPLLSK